MSGKEDSEVAAPVSRYNRKNVYFAALSVYSLFTGVGIIMGWASPMLPKMKEEQFNFTEDQYALFASIPNLAPGPLISMFGINNIGRKWSLFTIWACTVIWPVVMLITKNLYAMLTARFIAGFGMGAAFSVIGVYVAEIADVGVRSSLNSSGMIFLTVGSVITAAVGPFVSFTVFTVVALIVSSLFAVLWLFLPESPYFLVGKGRDVQARQVIERLRIGASRDAVDEELKTIKTSIEEERRVKAGFKKLFTSMAVLKEMILSFYILYLQQGSGLGPLGAYQLEIFDKAKLPFEGAYVPIAMALVNLIFLIPGPLLLNLFGTKTMFMVGGFGSGLFMFLLGGYFYFLNAGYDVSSFSWISIVFSFAVNLCVFVGLGGAVWGTVSELFAPSVKGYATGICGIFSTFLGFVATQTFSELKNSYGLDYAFLWFGLVQFIASIGLIFMVDTTKMTLQEIQDYFEGKTDKNKKNISSS